MKATPSMRGHVSGLLWDTRILLDMESASAFLFKRRQVKNLGILNYLTTSDISSNKWIQSLDCQITTLFVSNFLPIKGGKNQFFGEELPWVEGDFI